MERYGFKSRVREAVLREVSVIDERVAPGEQDPGMISI